MNKILQKKKLILCLICFIYNSLQSFLRIRTMAIYHTDYVKSKKTASLILKKKYTYIS